MTQPTADSDPIKYANRPLERDFDEMQAVREMLAKLDAGRKGKE